MSLRDLDKFGGSSPEAAQIVKKILEIFNGDYSQANKFWMRCVERCLWTKEIWGDRDRAERVAAGLILRTILTEEELKAAGIELAE
jgi:hypothetical protein